MASISLNQQTGGLCSGMTPLPEVQVAFNRFDAYGYVARRSLTTNAKSKRNQEPSMTTATGLSTTWFMRLMQAVSSTRLVSEKLKMELYPPFFLMRVKILSLKNSWRSVRIKLPLNTFSRNPGGVMFGGYQACLADPIAALACSRVFPGYSCWTRGMTLDLRKGGTGDLELRFEFPKELEDEIREELAAKGRSTPIFTYGFYLPDGTLCTSVTNTVAIRPKGYIGATSPPAESEFTAGKAVGIMEEKVREKVVGELVESKVGKDGIDRAGFRRVVDGMGMGWTDDQVDDLFDVLDKDGNGR
eukprot:CAMPEP_0118648494 /NCGR_PEP_ID=MMETSP0785-20121206/9187_1 /TAXON_ID=91992 /ORGANISM="Bolidomonas pacifica, Strain CCMP 1866" /LENGTH=300 /DNA_ID=CAMNT_0006540693 /DNA_START=30 /DNA_END=929 /DNA_ORIENTATION=+